MKLCKCGCGNPVTKNKYDWLKGHYAKANPPMYVSGAIEKITGKNSHRWKERKKAKCKLCGKVMFLVLWETKKYCSKECYSKSISIRMKKHHHWKDKKYRKEMQKRMKENNPMNNLENRKKISIKHKQASDKRSEFMKKNNPMFNKKSREKVSLSKRGEKNPDWKGGISFAPYPIGFDRILKEKIKKRDKYKCFICKRKINKRLCVHHIDYDKNNLLKSNLISLCNICHIMTNHNRLKWIKYFNNKFIIKIRQILEKIFKKVVKSL